MRKDRCSVRLAVTAAVLLAAAPIDAQNLVHNGTFNTDVTDWPAEDSSAQVIWSPLDANGSSSSGSALVANVSTGPSNGIGIHQCLSGPGVVPGARYTYGGRVRIPSGQARTGFVMFGLRWYTSTDCSGNAEDQPRVDTRTLGSWVSLEDVSVAPAGARSVEVLAFPSKVEAGGELHALFDDIFLLPRVATLTIPSSASIHGVSGTFFHTDLWIMNLSRTNTQTVNARFRCFRGQSCSSDVRAIALAPRATTLLADVVGDFFGSPETSGAIELSYTTSLGEIAATSRTYTPSLPAPTAGAAVAAAGAAGVVTTNASLVVRSSLPVFPFVTVIDNQSGDFVWVTPIDDP